MLTLVTRRSSAGVEYSLEVPLVTRQFITGIRSCVTIPRNASVRNRNFAAAQGSVLTSLGEFAGGQVTQRAMWTSIVVGLPSVQCGARVLEQGEFADV